MKTKLKSKTFATPDELTEFVNEEEINRDDIISINSLFGTNGEGVFQIFYYRIVPLTFEELEEQSRLAGIVGKRFGR